MVDEKEPKPKGFFSRMFGREKEAPQEADAPVEEAQIPIEPETVAPAPQASPEEGSKPEPPKKKGFFARLKEGLSRSSNKLTDGVAAIFTKRKLDDAMLEELEDLLITADLGVATAARITAKLSKERFDKEISDAEVKAFLADEIAASLAPCEQALEIGNYQPSVILMIGVNGAGKTTTIGKLARKFKDQGKSVMLAAGDTFRAAAIEQLSVWGERNEVEVVTSEVGADAAGLAFDAVKRAQSTNIDVLMIDTAGRLQNRSELMDELAKIVRVIKKCAPDAPHHTLLVLDATVGQNALSQAEIFRDIAGVNGLIMTKLDGTARGGVLVALADKFSLPIYFVGVGEQAEDLQVFNAKAFANALVGLNTSHNDTDETV